jgi:hypothetical protein
MQSRFACVTQICEFPLKLVAVSSLDLNFFLNSKALGRVFRIALQKKREK